jgi:acyl-CoA thioesterase-1
MRLPARAMIVILLAALTGFCGERTPPAPVERPQAEIPATEGVIVAVGDSLTAGFGLREEEAWPALLERRLRAEGTPWKVHNAGVSGETSSGARSRIDWILRLEPDIVVLETGANDGLRGISPRVLRENLDAILTSLQEAKVTVVLAGMRMVTNLGADYTAKFEQVYPDLAGKHGVILIPFLLEGIAGDPHLNQPDGIHPTAEGHRIMMETAYPYVTEAISPSSMRRTGRPKTPYY